MNDREPVGRREKQHLLVQVVDKIPGEWRWEIEGDRPWISDQVASHAAGQGHWMSQRVDSYDQLVSVDRGCAVVLSRARVACRKLPGAREMDKRLPKILTELDVVDGRGARPEGRPCYRVGCAGGNVELAASEAHG